MATRSVPLPTRCSKTAPRFDIKDPLSLWDYLADYEALAEAAQLDEATKIQRSITYLTRDEADLWESLEEYSKANDWTAFKNTILSFYPGSIPKDRWRLEDLSVLCDEQKMKNVQTRGDFAEFNRRFSTVSNSLISSALLSELEARKLFWSSLDQGFKDQLIRKVELTKPAYTSRTILTLAEIRHAAGLVLDGTVAETSSATSKNAKRSNLVPSLESVKLEPVDIERFTHQTAVMMAKIVETAVTTALNQAISMYMPSWQTNTDIKGSEVNPTHTNRMPRNVSAPQNSDAIQTSANLVEVGSTDAVKTHVEPKEGLDAFIAALQKFSLPGNKEDEGLEDAIQALKACISKKGDKISRQGPQEKRRVPMVKGPSIPVSTIVPSTPAGERAPEQPYQVQIPHEVLVKPADALDLSREVTISVEELLALCPDVREYFRNATTTRCGENPKEEGVKASTVAVYLVEEGPSEPKEASSKVFSFEESLAGEDAAVKAEKQQNKELVDQESEVSYCPSVSEVFSEKECLLLFPHVTDPHRNEGSSIYSQSRSVDTWSSMYLFSPPVSSCPSFAANLLRSVFIESTVVKPSPQISRKKKSQPPAVKKIERLLYDPGGGGSVQFNAEALDSSQHRDSMFPSKPEEQQASFVEVPTVVAATSRINGPLRCNIAAPVNWEKKAILESVVSEAILDQTSVVQRTLIHSFHFPSFLFSFQGSLYPQFRHLNKLENFRSDKKDPEARSDYLRWHRASERQVSLAQVEFAKQFVFSASQGGTETTKSIAPLLDDLRNRVSVRLETSWMAISSCAYLGILPNEETRVRTSSQDSTLHLKYTNPQASFVDNPIVVSAASTEKTPSMSNKANRVRNKKITDRGKIVPASFDNRHNPQKIFLVSLCIPQSPSPGLYPSIRCFDVPSDHRDDSRGSEMEKSQRLLKDMALVPYDSEHGELVSFEAFWMYVFVQAYLAKLAKAESLVCSQNQDTALLLQSEIVFVIETSTAVAVMSQIIERAMPNAATPIKRETRVKCTRIVPAVALAETSLARRCAFLHQVLLAMLCLSHPFVRTMSLRRKKKLRRRRRRRSCTRMMFVEGLRLGRNSCSGSLKRITRGSDVRWREQRLAHNRDVEIEPTCETKRGYPEPRFDGWRNGRSLPASGRRQHRQQNSHRSIPIHTIPEETRVAHRYSPSYSIPTPKRTRRLQTRLRRSRKHIARGRIERAWFSRGSLHQNRVECRDEASLSWTCSCNPEDQRRSLDSTRNGAVGKLACRVLMPALSCTVIGY